MFARRVHRWRGRLRQEKNLPENQGEPNFRARQFRADHGWQIIGGRADASHWKDPAHFAQTRNFILKAA